MRDLHRFCILSFTFLLIFSSLYLAKNIKEVSNGEYKYTLPGREIYQAIGKSQRKTNIKKLIIGDSTGNQFFNVFTDEDSIYSLACNQVIGMCGHYFLLDDFLKNGNRPEHVYMIFNVFSFSNNLDQNYTFHYFLKPFYKKEYRDRMSRTVIKIRRKGDGKILTDVINDACQVHNIYDGDELILSDKEWMIGYSESEGFLECSDFEEVKDGTL